MVVRCGNADRRQLPLDKAGITLGRARGCDIELGASDVSAVHCIITRDASGLSIRDCKGRGGTHVNGERITESPLRDGDVLQVGSFSFEVRLPAEYLAPAPRTLPADLSVAGLRHVLDSRRRLALRALRLRRLMAIGPGRSRDTHRTDPTPEGAVEELVASLRVRIARYEMRLRDLHNQERELAAERARLRAEARALRANPATIPEIADAAAGRARPANKPIQA